MKTARILDRMIWIGTIMAIVVAPWLFGSVEFYAIDLLAIWVVLLWGLWAIKALVEQNVTLFLTPVHAVVLAVLAWSLIQLVPFPFDVHHGVFRWNHISLDPPATRRAILKLSMLIGYFFLLTQLMHTPGRLRQMLNILIILGFAVAIVGILNKLTFNGRILWFRPSPYAANAFGPFVNRNHFAGFMELLIPLPMALIVGRGVRRDQWIVYGFMAVVMGAALVLSTSRGGLVSLGVEFLVLPILAGREWRRWRQLKAWSREGVGALTSPSRAPANSSSGARPSPDSGHFGRVLAASLVLAGGILVSVMWIGAEPVINRLSLPRSSAHPRPIEQQLRPATWRNTLKMIRAHPLVGVGLGAYPRIYPYYDDSTGYFSVGAAHNDYLQVLADLGLVGGALGFLFLITLFRIVRRALSFPIPLERSTALGCAVGSIGLAVHSFVDFNLQITANALLFLVIVALACTSDWRVRRTGRHRSLPSEEVRSA